MNFRVEMHQDFSCQSDRIESIIKKVERNTNDLKCLTAQSNELKSQIDRQNTYHSDFRKEVTDCKQHLNESQAKLKQVDCNTMQIKELLEKKRKQDDNKRKLQIVWEMVPETQGEKVYQMVAETQGEKVYQTSNHKSLHTSLACHVLLNWKKQATRPAYRPTIGAF